MTEPAGFTVRGRNPDVLTWIAHVPNDEVLRNLHLLTRGLILGSGLGRGW